jgi:hypothetical protein
MSSALLSTSPAPLPDMTKHRGSTGSGVSANDWRARGSGQFGLDDVFRWDEEEEGGIDAIQAVPARRASSSNTSYPGVTDGDPIRWSRWDELRDTNSPLLVRRLSFLGYSMGLQIWDCTSLGAVEEILNLSGSDWRCVTFAGVLSPLPQSKVDPFASQRPLIGVV